MKVSKDTPLSEITAAAVANPAVAATPATAMARKTRAITDTTAMSNTFLNIVPLLVWKLSAFSCQLSVCFLCCWKDNRRLCRECVGTLIVLWEKDLDRIDRTDRRGHRLPRAGAEGFQFLVGAGQSFRRPAMGEQPGVVPVPAGIHPLPFAIQR